MSAILEVKNLSKCYKTVNAVNGISFSLPRGICFGLLGPNGAGKTTTIEMIEGITEPSGGEILYNGKPRDKQFKFEAGIQFQQTALPDYLTVKETLHLFASFYPKTASISELITRCDLQTFLDQPSTKLSGGQRQRLLLALALINDPMLVFLDEPTTGLDPQSRRRFWQLIDNTKKQGKTVILTTHYMDEAEYLCDDLVIMDHGKIIDQGSPKQLLGKHFEHAKISIERTRVDEQKLKAALAGNDTPLRFTDEEAIILTTSVENTLQTLIAQQIPLSTLSVHNPTLEDLFIKLTGHQLRG